MTVRDFRVDVELPNLYMNQYTIWLCCKKHVHGYNPSLGSSYTHQEPFQ